MITIFLVMLGAMAFGWTLRKVEFARGWLPRSILVVILALMALIGVEVGTSDSLLDNLSNILSDTLLLLLGALAGTIAAAWAVGRWIVKIKSDAKESTNNSKSTHTFSFLIVGVFVAGVIAGHYDVIAFDVAGLSSWALYLLMALVGFSIGGDSNTLRALKSQPLRVIFVPLATIIGTLLGVLLISPLVDLELHSQLAIGSGFGYYSLSSVMLSEIQGVEIGAIALLVNVLRELFTVIAAPILSRKISPLAVVCCGGATTLDVTLPVIITHCGVSFIGVAIFHGVVVDLSVPLLVTLFSA